MDWRTRLQHPNASAPADFRGLAPAVWRGSTVAFPRAADAVDDWRQDRRGYTYGPYGTPTVLELGARIAEIEGARYTFIAPGGQAAIAVVYLALCASGDHALIPQTTYGPSQDLADGLLKDLGIEIETYHPALGAGLSAMIRPNTRLIWTESPGSLTMDVQDVPAIVGAARTAGVPVAIDNSYAAGVLFDAFAHGVDISIQSLTKYVAGHSDAILGSISVVNEDLRERVGRAWSQLGMAVSPDEASLALRGLQTLPVRLERSAASGLAIAHWLSKRPEVELVLHPALPDCPGHEIWRRDFKGATGLFSFVVRPETTPAAVDGLLDRLGLFSIGYGWGGTTSLAMRYPQLKPPYEHYGGRLIRLSIGLEAPDDLIADLDQAFDVLRA